MDPRAGEDAYLHHWLTVCLVAICAGIVMKLPVVWGLALFGIIVTVYRLRHPRAKRNAT